MNSIVFIDDHCPELGEQQIYRFLSSICLNNYGLMQEITSVLSILHVLNDEYGT